jgi:hypothetical protein
MTTTDSLPGQPVEFATGPNVFVPGNLQTLLFFLGRDIKTVTKRRLENSGNHHVERILAPKKKIGDFRHMSIILPEKNFREAFSYLLGCLERPSRIDSFP